MARRRRRKKAIDYIRLPDLSLDLDPETKKGIFIVFIIALGAISLLGLFDKAGVVGVYLKDWLTVGFGWGRWLIPCFFIFWGYMLYDDERFELRKLNYLGFILLIFSFHTLLFLFIERDEWTGALKEGAGGGYAGHLLAGPAIDLMGLLASIIVFLGILIISFLLSFNTTLSGIFGRESYVAKLFFPVAFVLGKIFNREEREEDDEEDEEPSFSASRRIPEDKEEEGEEEDEEENERDEEDEDEEEEEEEEEDEEDKKTPEFIARQIEMQEMKDEIWWKPTGLEINLPLSLLDKKAEKPTSGDIKHNKEIIQKALENFGIPVEMGDVSVGPTVTQYTFKPAEGIKLSRITNLGNDLALALAAHPIRIEAPIPGKSLVGVEVPNHAKAIVGLREIMSSKIFRNRRSDTTIALGRDVAGRPWIEDIAKMPHLLVAGATNSGKSVCLNSVIVSLMYQNNPDDLKFILVDPKRVEMPVYNNIPYLLCPVITDITHTVNSLKWCLNEMDRRFDILSKEGHRNIQSYNESSKIRMPYIIFVIDELADLMVAAAKDIEAGVIRLAQMSRAVGIHLVLATQRPSVDIITGLIKANMPARIAFSVASGMDSRTILDVLGAEKLLGRGDMLFVNAEMSKPARIQGAFLSDQEIRRIIRFIKQKSKGAKNYLEELQEKQSAKGFGGIDFGGEGEDELLGEAREIVINMNKASASLLQRKLRIGYARAASILDALEKLGVIGPANGSKPREILISREQHEAQMSTGPSGVSLHRREETEMPESFLGEESDFPPFLRKDEEEDDEEEFDDDEDIDEEGDEDIYEDDEDENGEAEDEEEPADVRQPADSGVAGEEEDLGKYFSR